VLEDGGFVLWESTAIMQYLATQEPGRKLWPENARQQADVSRWQSWRLAHWGPACGTFTFENLVKKLLGAGEPDAAVLAKGEENFHKYASVLDAHLKGRQYVVGDDMTLADIAIGSWLTYREPAKMPIEKYTEILRWHDALEKQDAWKKVPGGFS
jgi:glutathione S-transferase